MGVDIRGPVTWTVVGSGSGDGSIGTGSASLTIMNSSGATIFYAYISPSTSSTWGDDVLGTNVISDGDSFTVTGIAEGTYDLKVEDSNHNVIETQMGVTLSGEIGWEVTGEGGGGGNTSGGTYMLDIVNNSGMNIWYLYISPSTSSDWGEDWLGSDTIPNGTTYTVTGIPAGTYDLQVRDSNNNVIVSEMDVLFDRNLQWELNAP